MLGEIKPAHTFTLLKWQRADDNDSEEERGGGGKKLFLILYQKHFKQYLRQFPII